VPNVSAMHVSDGWWNGHVAGAATTEDPRCADGPQLARHRRADRDRTAHRSTSDTAVLVLTMLDDDSVLPAIRAGARGYLLEDADVDNLLRRSPPCAGARPVGCNHSAEAVTRALVEVGAIRA
jgi:DNA-binding NarL/FixJ family response regulator